LIVRWIAAAAAACCCFGALAGEESADADHASHLHSNLHAFETVIDGRVNDPVLMRDRAALLDQGEAALARGDTTAAIDTFERAAMMLHAPDTEMGLVRTYMQLGQYRRALAFCAHTAGTHLESASAGALYAWLLRSGGQGAVAERVLAETLQRAPQDAVANDTRRAFVSPLPVATGSLLTGPHRMAPRGVMTDDHASPPRGGRVVGSAVLIGGGTQALVPSASLPAGSVRSLWVRNGLGQTVHATADAGVQPLAARGVTVLRLDAPLDTSAAPSEVPRDPFAGSPGFVAEYAVSSDGGPAWPWLQQGFLGTLQSRSGLRSLGISVPPGPLGGPVFDAAGQLAGMAMPGPDGEPILLPASTWVESRAPEANAPAGPRPRTVIPLDQAYEGALKLALQVIVER
jgi:hypothetical protein